MPDYDALLIVSFGGPESREEVLPFLKNVLRGKNVPRERMLEVAEHYYLFDGRSPINDQNRALIAAVEAELQAHGPRLSVFWGNRNWHPLLPDALARMRDEGVERALAFFTSAYSSYSGCRQYRENIADAQAAVEGAPQIHKLRAFFNHPGFIEPNAEHVRQALERFPAADREQVEIVYTAHSIPLSMARTSRYVAQLEEAARLVAERVGPNPYRLVWQSRSGPPSQPWLEPDVVDYLREVKRKDATPGVVVSPIGFISDHMEVLYDLDTEAKQVCDALDLPMARAATVGAAPRFVAMIRELIEERMSDDPRRLSLGALGPSHDFCPVDCCPKPARPAAQR